MPRRRFQRPNFLRGSEMPDVMSPRYRLFRGTLVVFGRLFLGFTVHGADSTPRQGQVVVASNHHRFLDPVFVGMAVPRRLLWMAKKELFTPPMDKLFYFIGSFPVDREKGGRSALRAALTYLKEGWPLGIFPEGTRRRDKLSGEVKSGAVMLAVRSEAPVLPVYVDEVPGFVGRLRGEKLRVYIGEPIAMDHSLRGGRAYREAADEIMAEIYALPKRFKERQLTDSC